MCLCERERNFELLGTFSSQQRRSSHSKQGQREREREFMGFWAFGFPSKKKISPIIKGGGGTTRSVSFAVSLSSQFVLVSVFWINPNRLIEEEASVVKSLEFGHIFSICFIFFPLSLEIPFFVAHPNSERDKGLPVLFVGSTLFSAFILGFLEQHS